MLPIIVDPKSFVRYIFQEEIINLNKKHEPGVLQRQMQLTNCKNELLVTLNTIENSSVIIILSEEQMFNFIKEGKTLYEITLDPSWSEFTVQRVLTEHLKVIIKK